ncbi:MAG: sigma-54 dependent transcriptional regulator [Proteobacteria bacterium]|nr:sigma-54 dependent transcriptional regulator [Pseudomonadota bacterium]MBU0967262.1 sigma-54 dependent transcriptional regulator [Pseudomonadota bacterium]
MNNHILLIDDDESLRRVTEYNLAKAGFSVKTAANAQQGIDSFQRHPPELVVTDVELGDASGLELLKRFKQEAPDVPVIIITAYGSIEMAVQAMHQGAFTFITKPFDRDTLILSCRKALEMQSLKIRARSLSQEINRLTGVEGMVTVNSAMAELLHTALKVAESDATVLISGESGTGKEVLARLIHQHSQRKKEPFMAVNCAAIPAPLIESELFGHVKGAFTGAVQNRQGRFQAAHHGTLFLDEIGELLPEMQVKFLRVLQEKQVEPVGSDRTETVDVRIIAATNRDLRAEISKGNFRDDLFYRLSVIPLHLPPLRDRREDIPALVAHFLKRHEAPPQVSFTPGALARLQSYHWPGNIRELQNVVERCIILREKDAIDEAEILLPGRTSSSDPSLPDIPPEGLSLEEVEKGLILKALAISKGNRSEAARLLKIPRHVLIYRLEKYSLDS